MAVAMSGLALVTAAGCDSTQDKNARAQLVAERQLQSRERLDVARANRDVDATGVSIVRGSRSSAIVVDLHNRSDRTLTDVPIEVGIRDPDERHALNAQRNLDWFQTHVPAVPAGGATTWVFKQRKAAPRGRPYARVGVLPPETLSRTSSLPRLVATASRVAPAIADVTVENPSDVPQYGVQVYAFVRAGDRYLAAGKAGVEHLGTGKDAVVRVPLTGRTSRGALRVFAVPTIFE